GRLPTEQEDIAVTVVHLGEGIGRVCAEGDHTTVAEVFPQVGQRPMDRDVGEVVVVESGPAQLRIGQIEPERFDEVEMSPGDRGEPNGIARVAGYLGSVEDDVDVHHPLIFSLPALPSCHAVGSGAGSPCGDRDLSPVRPAYE